MPRPLANAAAKGVLLALADRCNDDGLEAWPSRSTIAREVAVCPDTVDDRLRALRDAGLIVIQARAGQHRPATWALNLAAIVALIDPVAMAKLNEEDLKRIAFIKAQAELVPRQSPQDSERDPTLAATEETESGSEPYPTLSTPASGPDPTLRVTHESEPDSEPDPTLNAPALGFGNSALGISPPAWDRVPNERYFNGTENKDRTSARTPSFTKQAKEPNGTNFWVIRRIAIEHLKVTGKLAFGDLVEAVKQQCADRQVDYGRHDAVPNNVVHRACVSAEFEVLLKPKVG